MKQSEDCQCLYIMSESHLQTRMAENILHMRFQDTVVYIFDVRMKGLHINAHLFWSGGTLREVFLPVEDLVGSMGYQIDTFPFCICYARNASSTIGL